MGERGTPPPIAAPEAAMRRGARAIEASFRRSLRHAMVIPVVVLTAGSAFLVILILSLRSLHAWVDHTDVVIAHANLLQKLTTEREDALRGYLLSHEQVFLDQFNGVDLQLSPLFDTLQDLVADNPPQVQLLRDARVEVIRSRHHAAQQVDRVRANEAFEAVARHVGEGTSITRGVIVPLDAFIATEQRLRARRVRRVDELTLYALVIGVALGILVGSGVALATARQMRLVRKRYVEAIEQQERMEAALEAVNLQLRDVNRRKDDFLGVLSHELRNPLAPILNSVHVLSRTDAASDRANRARAVIERQVNHLTRLVDDLLDVKRISAGKMHLRTDRIDVVASVREVVEDLRALFVQRGIRLELRTPAGDVWIDGDPTRIAQVVGNLLGNAAKFTDRGGEVTVSVDRTQHAAEIRVRDTGVGIKPELLGSLFDPFVQGEQTLERSLGGLGLGLSLVRGIVQLHGGTVQVASEPGVGTEFTVTLPLAISSASTISAIPALVERPRRRVLVVEDNDDAAESLRDLLEVVGGHEVFVARDGAEGIAAATDLRPDVVLCDLGLPKIDGYEVAREIRRRPATASMRLIALSGYASPEDVERSLQAGFDYHLPKPPDIEALMKVLAFRASPGESEDARTPKLGAARVATGGKPDGRPA